MIEADGKTVLPGFIDPHVHILGGGGEGGPATRAPEIAVEDIVAAGVTTVIGCLGHRFRHPAHEFAPGQGPGPGDRGCFDLVSLRLL